MTGPGITDAKPLTDEDRGLIAATAEETIKSYPADDDVPYYRKLYAETILRYEATIDADRDRIEEAEHLAKVACDDRRKLWIEQARLQKRIKFLEDVNATQAKSVERLLAENASLRGERDDA